MPFDLPILGGGLAGAAAAVHLARAGRSVTLIDRESTPKHKVCGEFLSAEALHLLGLLGVDPEAHGAGCIHTVRLASAHLVTKAQLPFAAQSLTRRCLDSLVLQAAEGAGVRVLRGATAQSLTQTSAGWEVVLSTGQTLTAPQVLLATGKHDLRGFPRPQGPQGDLIALKMYFRLAPEQTAALQNCVELLLHPQAYTGLQLVEDNTANLTMLIHRRRFAKLGGWSGVLAEIQDTNSHARLRLQGAEPLLAKPLALSAIPYGFVRRDALGPGLYAAGDQAAVIPSFTGDGMSIALFTGLRAAEAILAHQPASVFQPKLHAQLRWQVARATLLSRALLHPTTGGLVSSAAHLWPGTLGHAAALTRLAGVAWRTAPAPLSGAGTI